MHQAARDYVAIVTSHWGHQHLGKGELKLCWRTLHAALTVLNPFTFLEHDLASGLTVHVLEE